MNDMAQRLAGLSLHERALLFERLRERKRRAPQAPALARALAQESRAADPPLSFAQQRLWFLDRLMPGDAVYNIAAPLLVTGPLDCGRLRAALAALVARHEALRTTFRLAGVEPVQVIAAAHGTAPALPVVDLSALGEPARAERAEEEAARLRDADAGRPFDLAAGPLLRTALLKLAPERHLLLLTLHHIVGDGWSIGVLVRDLTALYEGRGLPELPIQYADFAIWQRRWLAGEVLQGQIDLWRRRLAGMRAALDLPSDRPRPAVRSSRGALLELTIEPQVTVRLKDLARRQGATLFTVLLAAFQALLHRSTGQEDLCVGTPVANRNRPEVAGLIGFFVNTLVLRGDLSGDPGLGELVGRLRDVALEAFDHQDLPFEKLVEELQPRRDPSRTPLVQVLLALQNMPRATLAAGGLRLEPAPAESRTAKLDLSLALEEDDRGGLGGGLTYSSDLFDAATMRRFAAHFVRLASAAADDPGRRLSELPLLAEAEMAQLLREWNDTRLAGGPAAERAPLHLRFAAQAARTPAAVAVETAERRWTYRELESRAGRLARRLRGLGVGPEVVVAVQADRSPELVLGALAVWAAGGVYLPLDPSHPRARRAWTLADAGAALLLAADGDEPPPFAGPVLRLAEDPPASAAAGGLPAWEGSLDALAYVLYTSGSSGRPKGVMVPHRALANMAAETARFGAGPGSRVLLFASPAFDASLLDLALALGSGAALVLVPGRELPGLGRLLGERAITHLHLPPSALAALATPENAAPAAGLSCLILGGEPCPEALADRWGRGRRLFNDYGPTEAAVFATVDEQRDGRLTTGRPIAGVAVHLLDGHLQPVPLGVPGEICLAGAGLARGYLGRPDLTAERFVPHPYPGPEESGSRLYRTGDLARRWPDGALDSLGRIDRQVKIRGVRIEPGEVEAALARHPAVREVAVTVQGSGVEASLAAWVVPVAEAEGATGLTPAVLRAFLREALPAPMVPAALFFVARLPLTANGKLDRSALARLAPAGEAAEPVAAAPPRGDLERAVAAAWSAVLGPGRAEPVARNVSFFDLGGHSLLLARVQALLAERLGREVPLLKLFEHPTVEALAGWLDGVDRAAAPTAPATASRERAERQRQGLERQRQRTVQGRAS